MAASDLLLEEEEIDENHLLLEYYEENQKGLDAISLYEVPQKLKFEVAVLFSIANQIDYEWMAFLEDLGVDPITIGAIDFKSSKTGILPIYIALNGILQRKRTFGQVIQNLCKKEKFHILRHLKPFVEGILKAKSIDIKKCNKTQDQLQEFENKCLQKAIFSSLANNSETLQIHIPSTSSAEPISAFILHTAKDRRHSQRLALSLRESNLKVITLADVSDLLRVNPTKMLKALYKKVDFTLPVVSKTFLEQLNDKEHSSEESRIEKAAILFVYDLALNEYSCRGCKNFRVRSVCLPDPDKACSYNDPILSWCFQLWDEVPKLIDHLKKTKNHFYKLKF